MKQTIPEQRKLTVYALAQQTGSAREDVAKWLQAAGKDTANLTEADAEDCVRIIRGHQSSKVSGRKAQMSPVDAMCDESGVPWNVVKTKEEARKLRRENTIAERQIAQEWISIEAHHRILSNLCSKLEQIPSKFKSESGCSAANEKKLRDMIDQTRIDAVAEERKALEDGKKKGESAK